MDMDDSVDGHEAANPSPMSSSSVQGLGLGLGLGARTRDSPSPWHPWSNDLHPPLFLTLSIKFQPVVQGVNLARRYSTGFLTQDLRMPVPAGYPLRFYLAASQWYKNCQVMARVA